MQVRLINGQIVLDTDSLTVERRGVDQDYGDGAMEVVEENAMSRRVNSQTYSKRKQSARWDEVETAQFYDVKYIFFSCQFMHDLFTVFIIVYISIWYRF